MGLHPKWGSLLTPREPASLSPDFPAVSDHGTKDDLVNESDHRVGALGNFDQPWIQQKWTSIMHLQSAPEQCWT